MSDSPSTDQPKSPERADTAPHAMRHKRYSADYQTRLDAFLSGRGIPAFVLEVVGFAWFIADTFGRVDFWRSVVAEVGGNAEMLGVFLGQPLFPVLLMVVGAFLWWFITEAKTNPYDRAMASSLCWILSALIVVPLSSFGLFADFVNTSSISGAIEFAVNQQQDRSFTTQQTTLLYSALRKIAEGLPKFQVLATHDPETLQYACLIMQSLYSANVKLLNGEAGSSRPAASDVYSTSDRGIMIVVENPMAPPKAALDLQDAFGAADIKTHVIKGADLHGDDLFLLVGPK